MSRELFVYLCGKLTGVLSEDDYLQLSFRYIDKDAAPLSVRLPVREDGYSHPYVFPFFENLTPEGEAFEILAKEHISGNKVYSILDRFGGDCAGAVSLYKSSSVNNDNEPLHEIDSAKIAQIIDRLPEDPLLTSLENPPRLSLAGAQSKFAVYKSDNQYYRSDDKHPTTHIIKITNRRFPNLLENEFFCMKLAQLFFPDTPNVELKETEERLYLEIERFDRHIENGFVHRIHQEDFCQAFGIVSDKKYQNGGGPGIKDCSKIIEEYSNNYILDISRFIEWIVFNYLIGNTDAHAKNISLLHTESGIKLSPFYDLLSAEVYPQKIIDHHTAMLINGKGKYDSVGKKDFLALFEQLGLNAKNTMRLVNSKFKNVVKTAETLKDELNSSTVGGELFKSDVYDSIIKIIDKRWKTFNV